MNYYENIMIIDPNLNDKEIEKAVERVKDVINKSGGEILKSEKLGLKKLAYDVKKQKKGSYILLLLKAPPTTILELERFYKVFDPILKFLIVKLKKKQIMAALTSLSESEADTKNKEEETKDIKSRGINQTVHTRGELPSQEVKENV